MLNVNFPPSTVIIPVTTLLLSAEYIATGTKSIGFPFDLSVTIPDIEPIVVVFFTGCANTAVALNTSVIIRLIILIFIINSNID